jgi:2-dehydro-3-deoxyphosphooctonate aldolase (KDO 8-P synthase)
MKIGNLSIDKKKGFFLIAGPCVIEDYSTTFEIAQALRDITTDLDIPFIFKASYDKANRTSINSFRGPGIREGLKILETIRAELDIKVLSDVHSVEEVHLASEVLDILQIPAFLCRQTDLIVEAAGSGKPVNIKKGQFLAPWDVKNIIQKFISTGNHRVMITERGVQFGYNNLVVDFRGIGIMQQTGYPVVFDATHSVQLPGGSGSSSGGQREFAPILAKAAVSTGVDGLFIEVHKEPEKALCDGPNSLRLDEIQSLLITLKAIEKAVTS